MVERRKITFNDFAWKYAPTVMGVLILALGSLFMRHINTKFTVNVEKTAEAKEAIDEIGDKIEHLDHVKSEKANCMSYRKETSESVGRVDKRIADVDKKIDHLKDILLSNGYKDPRK